MRTKYDDVRPEVDRLVAKYGEILGTSAAPDVVVVDRLAENWLGRATWSPKRPDTTVIELQASVLGDPRTFERVFAHEMVHHWEMTNLSDKDLLLLRLRIPLPPHGPAFRQGAARVNDVMGEDFVTETSDKSYVRAPSSKPYYVLVVPTAGYLSSASSARQPYGYAWAVKIGDQAREKVDRVLRAGGRLVKTTDPRWTRGPKLKRTCPVAIPDEGSEDAALLAQMAAEAPEN